MAGNVQWWCSAQGVRWTWKWRPYPGIWLMVLAIAGAYWRLSRGGPRTSAARKRRALGWLGVVLAWVSLDWPLGPLAAGYLASAHAVQFLLLSMVVSPLLLLGIEPGMSVRPDPRGAGGWLLRFVTTPLVAGVLFNIVAITTHVPAVVDGLMVSQLGAFALDLSWLLSGLVLWWPVVLDMPRRRFPLMLKIFYIFLATLVHSGIANVMLLADFPIYSIYQLAPPMQGVTAMTDLQIAGAVMLGGGLVISFSVMSLLFYRYVQQATGPDGS